MASAVLLNLGWPPRSHAHSPVARDDKDDDHEKRTLIQPQPQPEPEPEPEPEPAQLVFTHHGPEVKLSENGTPRAPILLCPPLLVACNWGFALGELAESLPRSCFFRAILGAVSPLVFWLSLSFLVALRHFLWRPALLVPLLLCGRLALRGLFLKDFHFETVF